MSQCKPPNVQRNDRCATAAWTTFIDDLSHETCISGIGLHKGYYSIASTLCLADSRRMPSVIWGNDTLMGYESRSKLLKIDMDEFEYKFEGRSDPAIRHQRWLG